MKSGEVSATVASDLTWHFLTLLILHQAALVAQK